MALQATETYIPRCPHCGNGTIVLAPANGFTKWILAQQEIYCTNCQYRARLADDIKKIYIRS
jgi:DNA-directed RNA polymerase subunit RPC12/RpoP